MTESLMINADGSVYALPTAAECEAYCSISVGQSAGTIYGAATGMPWITTTAAPTLPPDTTAVFKEAPPVSIDPVSIDPMAPIYEELEVYKKRCLELQAALAAAHEANANALRQVAALKDEVFDLRCKIADQRLRDLLVSSDPEAQRELAEKRMVQCSADALEALQEEVAKHSGAAVANAFRFDGLANPAALMADDE
jgi:hypothetical protein